MWLEFPPWEHVDYKDQTKAYFKTFKRLSNVDWIPKQKSLIVLSQSIQREEEKPEASRRAAMAERTTPTLNGHFCRKLRRKERRSRIGARPSALRARIILSKYLRTPPLFFHAQKSYLMSSERALDLRWRAPKSRGETNLRVSQSQVAKVETW